MNPLHEQHLIVVAGRAETEVEPDTASWQFPIVTGAPTEHAALSAASDRARIVLARLKELVGDRGEVTTSQVSVSPEWDSKAKRHVGYEARTEISARMEMSLAGEVASHAVELGTRCRGPRFSVSDREARREELLGTAVGAARRRAERLAEASGRPLGQVAFVREPGVDRYEEEIYAHHSERLLDASSVPIAAPDHTISVEVVVGFEWGD